MILLLEWLVIAFVFGMGWLCVVWILGDLHALYTRWVNARRERAEDPSVGLTRDEGFDMLIWEAFAECESLDVLRMCEGSLNEKHHRWRLSRSGLFARCGRCRITNAEFVAKGGR